MGTTPEQPGPEPNILSYVQSGRFRENSSIRIALGVILVFVIALMFPHGEAVDFSYRVGTVWADKDLVAQFSFPILKDSRQYEKERLEARKQVLPVFRRNAGVTETQQESLATMLRTIRGVLRTRGKSRTSSPQDSTAGTVRGARIRFSESEWRVLQSLEAGPGEMQKLARRLSETLASALQTGIINQHKSRHPLGAIALREGSQETVLSTERIFDYDSAMRTIEKELAKDIADEEVREIALRIMSAVLRPNIELDEAETIRATQVAEENVARSTGFVQQNERIVAKNQLITDEIRLRLNSFQKARGDRGTESQEWRHWLGIVLHVSVVLGLYALYLYLFRKKIFYDNGKLLIIVLLLLFVAFLAYLAVQLPFNEPIQYLICVPIASMLLAIIFDSRVSFYGTVTLAFLVAAMRGNDYSIGLVSLVAGAFATYTVRDISHRTQIFRSIVFIFLGYAVAIIALSIEQFESPGSIGLALSFALANAVISPVLTYALLLFFERSFNITTDLTLVELADLNHPLLQELSEKAPGTFHHSVTIGNLAEAAAEAIGANAILAKVGGYYHDIGKMLKPEYFVENQVGTQSRHNRLRPRMSALIISSHVREGIELGRERKLPEKIIDFIPQHHGTNRISFFYDKAIRQAVKRPTKETINEDDFRYPGPKPQSKETGIVMLADSVEASTRALNEMTPHSLERAIDNMIKHRFLEGQLDECELTLRDLSNIREAFLQMLIGIHHQRIKYPEQTPAGPVEAPVVTEAAEAPAEALVPPAPEAVTVESPKKPESAPNEVQKEAESQSVNREPGAQAV